MKVECGRPGEDYAAGRDRARSAATRDRRAVPADAVTASGSGLDPHISARLRRAAGAARGQGARPRPGQGQRLIGEHTTGRALGFMGEPAVNVLELNLALDKA